MAIEKGSIKGAVINEVLRIALFLVYYIALICLGVYVFVMAFRVAGFLATSLEGVRNGRAVIGIIVAIAGVLSLAGVFGLYLIKPLFSFTKSRNEERVRVREEDCPRLFGLIKELSVTTGFRMPKHVFLTTDVNACVFYNTNFWSIFLPVRKNLEIGLGIFNATTIQEVKAILSHEFGHFGQSSMKIGSAVSVTNKVLYNLIYTDDFIDHALFNWRNSGWLIWKLFGMLAYGLTTLVKRMTVHVFLFVQRGERKLSRLMEFGADEVACRCAGTDAFVSAMCKTEVLAECDANQLRPFLKDCLAENKLPDDYFTAHDAVAEELRKYGWPTLSVGDMVEKPFDFGVVESRIKVKNIWSTHPELADRLEFAKGLSQKCAEEALEPSWNLIPAEVAHRVSNRFFDLVVADMEKKTASITAVEFHEFVKKSFDDNAFPLEFAPFFSRVAEKFDLQKAFDANVEVNPFTEEYKQLVGELTTAKSDMAILNQIASGEIEVEEFTYDGIEYAKKKAPIEQHKKYLDALAVTVSENDFAACSYLVHIGSESDHNHVKTLYKNMALMESMYSNCVERLSQHDAELNVYFEHANAGTLDEIEYQRLCKRVVQLEKDFQREIVVLKQSLPDAIPNNEFGRLMVDYTTTIHNSEVAYGPDSFQELQNYRSAFGSMCSDYHRRCRLALARFAQSRIKFGGK